MRKRLHRRTDVVCHLILRETHDDSGAKLQTGKLLRENMTLCVRSLLFFNGAHNTRIGIFTMRYALILRRRLFAVTSPNNMGVPMKNIFSIILVTLTLFVAPVRAQDAEKIASARVAAKSWLELADMGEYSQTWEQAAGVFQAAVSKPSWQSAIQGVRAPFGSLKSRTIKSATFTRSLPGAPDGEYVVIQYESRFENKEAAIETVTPMREKDGSWKVSGYFIK